MALTYANVTQLERGAINQAYAEITFDSAYTVAGETVAASDFGFAVRLYGLVVIATTAGWIPRYVRVSDTTGTLAMYPTASTTVSTGIPVEASVQDLSTVVVRVIAWGK